MSEIDTIPEGLDSHAMQSLETLSTNFIRLSLGGGGGGNLVGATWKIMLRDQSNNIHCKQ